MLYEFLGNFSTNRFLSHNNWKQISKKFWVFDQFFFDRISLINVYIETLVEFLEIDRLIIFSGRPTVTKK